MLDFACLAQLDLLGPLIEKCEIIKLSDQYEPQNWVAERDREREVESKNLITRQHLLILRPQATKPSSHQEQQRFFLLSQQNLFKA